MTESERSQAMNALLRLAEHTGKTLEETRKTLEDAYDEIIADPDPITRLYFLAEFPNGKPSAEEIILQLQRELMEEDKPPVRMTLQNLCRAWSKIRLIAEDEGTTPAEVRRSMQESIDKAWDNQTGDSAAAWLTLFPDGKKPSVEHFIITLGYHLRHCSDFDE